MPDAPYAIPADQRALAISRLVRAIFVAETTADDRTFWLADGEASKLTYQLELTLAEHRRVRELVELMHKADREGE